MDFILTSNANSVVRMDRLEEDLVRMKDWHSSFKERLDVLSKATQDLLIVSQNQIERVKRLEGRSDSIEEMTKVLRELLEANLRRPDKPGREDN